jgi:hypothetical protein
MCTNFGAYKGQQVRELCRLTRFYIPLHTGQRTTGCRAALAPEGSADGASPHAS